jgi:O-antigen/teichoic acid export membrane protein
LSGLSLLSLLRGFVLAGFLARSDYGVWGVLAVTLGTLLWLRQVGVPDKYIQQDDPDQELAFQKAFTLELLLSLATMVLLAAALPVVVVVYGEEVLFWPGLVAILILPAGALQMPLAAYYRRMHFVRQRTLQAVDPVVGFVVAVALAAAGAGYWALIGGMLAGAWSAAAVAVLKSPYRLRLRYDRGTLRSYASFSWPLFVASGSSVVIAQAAVLATEAHLGLAAVGAAALAAQITQFTDRVDRLVTGSLYPAICAVKDRADVLYESFVKSNRLALMWAVPFGFGVSLFAGDLVDFGIGEQWEPAVGLLQVTGAVAALGHIGFNWDAYFRALGNTRPMAVASAVAAVTFLAAGLPLLFEYGLDGLAAGIGLQMAAHVVCRGYYLQRLFHGFGFARHAVRALLPTVPAAGAVLAARLVESGERTGAIAIAELAAYLAITVGATWALERGLLREAAGYLRGGRAVAAPT